MSQQKTYWHLMPLKRMPTEYEIVSSRLLYYVQNGFEVNLPMQEWYDRYQRGSPLVCGDWEKFEDPRGTTYASYTKLRDHKESMLDELLGGSEGPGNDQDLSDPWIRILDRVLGPMRYHCHGLQMIACYLGQMSPSGRIAIAGLFQAADEIRRVERLSYRLRQLQRARPGFGETSRAIWQDDPVWQPLRMAVERLLIAYDWGECFVGLNLVLKPVMDELFGPALVRLARAEGDHVLAGVLANLAEDCAWHREWSRALVRTAFEDSPGNSGPIRRWIETWQPLAQRAAAAFAPVFDEMPSAPTVSFAEVSAALEDSHARYLDSVGLRIPSAKGPFAAERRPKEPNAAAPAVAGQSRERT